MKKKFIHTISILCLTCIMLMSSCKKINEFPLIPHIEFVSFTKIYNGTNKDDKGILAIYFTDGDGNIGFRPNEKDSSYNFFIDYYEKQEGKFVKIDLPSTLNVRLPIINTSKEPQPLAGNIELEVYFNNPLSTYDTIQLECWLFDRDSNESNHIFTPEIIVNK